MCRVARKEEGLRIMKRGLGRLWKTEKLSSSYLSCAWISLSPVSELSFAIRRHRRRLPRGGREGMSPAFACNPESLAR